MPNSLQSSAMGSPASRRATNCSLSSITEHSFHGIAPPLKKGKSVTYVSGTNCYLCVGSLNSVNDFHYRKVTRTSEERLVRNQAFLPHVRWTRGLFVL